MSATRDKCRDCGEAYETVRSRSCTDICDSCVNTRDRLVRGEIVDVTSKEFRMIQRKMCRGRGTAKSYIDSLIRKAAP